MGSSNPNILGILRCERDIEIDRMLSEGKRIVSEHFTKGVYQATIAGWGGDTVSGEGWEEGDGSCRVTWFGALYGKTGTCLMVPEGS